MNVLIYKLLATLMGITLSMSVVILFLLIIRRPMRKRISAGCRFVVWTLIMLRLCVPVGGIVLPSLISITAPTEPISVESEEGGASVQSDALGSSAVADGSDIGYIESTLEKDEDGFLAEDSVKSYSLLEKLKDQFVGESLWKTVFYLWISGFAVFIAINFISYFVCVLKISSTGLEPDDRTREIYKTLCREMKIEYAPTLIVSLGASGPMLYGYVSPKIVLPYMEFSDEALKSVLSHELVHHIRRDVYSKLIAMVGNAVHWFNPLAYFAAKTFAEETELSCDDRVLLLCDDSVRVSYSQAMLDVIRESRARSVSLATNFNSATNAVKERFVGILDPCAKRRGRSIICITLLLCIISGALVGYRVDAAFIDEQGEDEEITDAVTDETSALLTDIVKDTFLDETTLTVNEETTIALTVKDETSTLSDVIIIPFETKAETAETSTIVSSEESAPLPQKPETTYPETTFAETEESGPPEHVHNFTRMVREDATCTSDGYYEYYYCTGCSDVVRTPIYRTYNHRFTEMHGTAIIDGKEDFYAAIKCRNCGVEAAHRSLTWSEVSSIRYYISGCPYYTGEYNPLGELVIYGEGKLPAYFTKDAGGQEFLPPWYSHTMDYDLIRVGDYVTEISKNAFLGSCKYVNTVSIGRSVEVIEEKAFGDAYALKTLYLPKSLKTIEKGAFPDVSGLVIRYEGTEKEFEALDPGDLKYSQVIYNCGALK